MDHEDRNGTDHRHDLLVWPGACSHWNHPRDDIIPV
jgi:hypothetical protein